ncbi:MAG TPA: radical SAM protein [Rhodoplanes sp.]|nr:radical SAM protein [Rhodoplanes sp.]
MLADPILRYDQPLYRPPSEGRNLIIQATIGCSFNRCTFCSMYKTKSFRARPLPDIFADIEAAARMWPNASRVFLADGDALVLPTDDLAAILDKLAATFPRLERVSCYATPINLTHKPVAELRRLRANKLSLVYVGIESGAATMLNRIRKGATPATLVEALDRAHDAGIAVSATVVLGLGGRRLWREHIDGTASVVNRAPPDFLSTLQLRLDDDEVAEFVGRFERDGTPFEEQDDAGILAEQERLLQQLDPPRLVTFRSNHASNCLPLAGTLPHDRERLLALIARARRGAPMLRPEFMRGL